MRLNRPVLREELQIVSKFSAVVLLFINVSRKAEFQRTVMDLAKFLSTATGKCSSWLGQPWGNTKRVLKSLWEMPKGLSDSLWSNLKAIGMLLRNTKIRLMPAGQMFLLVECAEKSMKYGGQPIGGKAELLPRANIKNVAISIHFL
jgi:hypothetical protein